MITALKNKLDRLAYECFTGDGEMNAGKIIDCQRHLSFIPAHTANDIHSKLYICTMMGLCESELSREYLDAWAVNDFTFINANNDKALMQLKDDALQTHGDDEDWNTLFCSVTADINKFLCEGKSND